MNMHETFCPECERRLKLGGRPHQGQRVVCRRCETSLVVVSLNPLDLDLAMPIKHRASPKKKAQTVEAPCPQCDRLVKLNAHLHEGQWVTCGACQTTLEVVNTNPLELEVAMMIKKHNRQQKAAERRLDGRKSGRTWGLK